MFENIINKAKTYISTKDKNSKSTTKEIKGIDASSYNGLINWEKVAKTDVKFAILRSTTRNGKLDTKFWQNYRGATTHGIPVDVYIFSYALDTNKAISDAENLIEKLNGEKPVIWLDLEWSEQGKLGKDKVTEIATAFIKTCQGKGYECNVYSNVDWYKNYYHANKLKALGCKFWIARYGTNDGFLQNKYKPNLGEYIWQYTSKGEVSGITGDVDMNMKYETESTNSNNDTSTSTEITKIQKLVKIICTSVNIRKSPSTSSSIAGYYKNGNIVEVVGITKNKSWYKDSKGRYFTANSKYVTDLTGIVYNCYKLNLRGSNSTNGKVITVLDVNDKVNILKESGKWYYIETSKGIKGYVSSNYVKLQ